MKEKQLPKTAALSGAKEGLSNPVFATKEKPHSVRLLYFSFVVVI